MQKVETGSRDHYPNPNGVQCRLHGPDLQSGLCLRHFREKFTAILPSTPSDSEDLSADLLPEPTDFSYGEDVQKFLARLVVQVAKGRVSPRRAPSSATSPTSSSIPIAPWTRNQQTTPNKSSSTSLAPSATERKGPEESK